MSERVILSADVVYNGLGLPRTGGAVVVSGGRVVAVDDLAAVRRAFPNTPERHVGFALSPPPVNAHSHLDLSTMPYTPGAYEAFIERVMAHGRAGERGLAAAEKGLGQLRGYGTRVLGDIVTDERVMRRLLEADLEGVAYWEVTGPNPKDAESIFAQTVERLRAFRRLERPGGMRVGLAPHTPHTLSAPLLQKLSALARQNDVPLQIHLAETPGEVALHRDGSGPLAAFMRSLVPDWTPSGLSPLQYLERLGMLEARPTLVHMVHVDEDDVRAVQRAGCTVVHCPRSNEALGCGRFPWALYAKHGVTVAIGTDGLGSSPSLSVEEEVAAALGRHGDEASPQALVWAAVKGGYRALGMTPPVVRKGDPAAAFQAWG